MISVYKHPVVWNLGVFYWQSHTRLAIQTPQAVHIGLKVQCCKSAQEEFTLFMSSVLQNQVRQDKIRRREETVILELRTRMLLYLLPYGGVIKSMRQVIIDAGSLECGKCSQWSRMRPQSCFSTIMDQNKNSTKLNWVSGDYSSPSIITIVTQSVLSVFYA